MSFEGENICTIEKQCAAVLSKTQTMDEGGLVPCVCVLLQSEGVQVLDGFSVSTLAEVLWVLLGAPGTGGFLTAATGPPSTWTQGDKSNAAITIPTLPAQIPF